MRTKIAQPIWYHPTRLLIVDDEIKLIKQLRKKIDASFSHVGFLNPEKALGYLKENALPLEKLSQAIISEIEPSEERHLSTENIAIDFSPLRASLNNPTRFTQFVTVIVDKVMKEMDGLEFCRKVRELGLPVKLVLLTGNAGEEEAVAAFNQHLIDAFVKKSTPDMMDQINRHLRALSFQEFCDSSVHLLGPVINKLPLVGKDKFADFINSICLEQGVVEYCLLDSSCSYLLVKADGSTQILLVKVDSDFKNAYDIASSEEHPNSEVLVALKNRSGFPFTGATSYFVSNSTEWKDHMVPMKKQDELNFYYAIVDQAENVLSFDQYLNEIWKPEII